MKKISLALIVTLLMVCCQKDQDLIIDPILSSDSILQNYSPAIDIITGTVYGTVIDETRNPVTGANINYNGKGYTSDENGNFIIRDEALNRNGTFISIEKSGFFKGSRRFYPQDNSINYVYIQLLALNNIGKFNAQDGGTVVGTDKLEISFPKNSIQSNKGELHTGEVTVAAKFLDPTAYNISDIMPGDLFGVNSKIEEVSLLSYGMMAVELFAENGDELNLAPESEATLTFPIPPTLIDSAPQEIPLWSFDDDQYGVWVQEGSAMLQGEKYVGNVSHFSFWNCDIPDFYIKVSGQLQTSSRVPIVNASVGVTIDAIGETRTGYTDNNGFFCGYVPRDEIMTLSVDNRDLGCGYGTLTFGPFSNSAVEQIDLGIINLEEINGEEFTISGSVVDCDNNPVTNGVIRIELGSNIKNVLLDDSNFSIGLVNCEELKSLYIAASNFTEIGFRTQKEISPEIDCGNIAACGELGCIIPDELFTGSYLLTIDDNQGLGYGPAYESNQIVNIVPNLEILGSRKFSSNLLPEIGPFVGSTEFLIDCNQAIFQISNTGVGCGGLILFGPSLNPDGIQITAPINLEDDSEIILYINEGYSDGNCSGQTGTTNTKMVLTKI